MTGTSADKPQLEAILLNIYVHFLGHPQASGPCSQGEAGCAELCEHVKRNRKNQSPHDRHRLENSARFRVAPPFCGDYLRLAEDPVRTRCLCQVGRDFPWTGFAVSILVRGGNMGKGVKVRYQ